MVKRFLKNSTRILFQRQNTILSAATIMMLLILASRILGLIRNRLLAGTFGAGSELDIYNAAFALPDFIADFLITGALTVSFIPIMTSLITKNREKEAEAVASTVLNVALLIFGLIGFIIIIFANSLSSFLFPGFSEDQIKEVVLLTRFIIFSELILIIGSFFASILQSHYRFIIPALAPVAYNLGIIFGIYFFSERFGILGVVFGVILGAFLHVLIQLPLIKRLNFGLKWIIALNNKGVKKIALLSLPRALTIGMEQIKWLINLFLASLLVTGSVTIIKFSVDLQNFPIGLFGITVATAALPALSNEWVRNKQEEFKETFLSSLHQILFLSVPASIILITLRIPVVRLTLGSGKFDWNDTVTTATTLSFFAVSVFAQSATLLIARAFYAMQNSSVPLRVAFTSLILHALVGVSLIFLFSDVSYLAITSSISSLFTFMTLLFILNKEVGGFDKNRLFLPVVKIFLASFIMALLLYLPLHLKFEGTYVIDLIIDTTRTINLLLITLVVTIVGLFVYGVTCWYLKSDELQAYINLFKSFKGLGKAFLVEPKSTETTANP